MADARITDLSDGGAIQTTDEFVIARSGQNYKVDGSHVLGPLKIFSSILGGDAASIDSGAGSIPAGFSALEILLVLRTAAAGAVDNVLLRFNNDSGANYDSEDVLANTTTAPVSENVIAGTSILVIGHGSGGSASYAAVSRIVVPLYDQTTFFKTAVYVEGINDGTAGNNYWRGKLGTWRNTAAITRVAVSGSGVNLKTGSALLIYGLP